VRRFEEPVSSDGLDGLRELRDAVAPDVTAGEYGYDLFYFRRMCAAGAVDCLQAGVSRCGEITEWLQTAAVAASYGLDISGHCGPHLHAHVAAAGPGRSRVHLRATASVWLSACPAAGRAVRPVARSPAPGG